MYIEKAIYREKTLHVWIVGSNIHTKKKHMYMYVYRERNDYKKRGMTTRKDVKNGACVNYTRAQVPPKETREYTQRYVYQNLNPMLG